MKILFVAKGNISEVLEQIRKLIDETCIKQNK